MTFRVPSGSYLFWTHYRKSEVPQMGMKYNRYLLDEHENNWVCEKDAGYGWCLRKMGLMVALTRYHSTVGPSSRVEERIKWRLSWLTPVSWIRKERRDGALSSTNNWYVPTCFKRHLSSSWSWWSQSNTSRMTKYWSWELLFAILNALVVISSSVSFRVRVIVNDCSTGAQRRAREKSFWYENQWQVRKSETWLELSITHKNNRPCRWYLQVGELRTHV